MFYETRLYEFISSNVFVSIVINIGVFLFPTSLTQASDFSEPEKFTNSPQDRSVYD